jgi:hypothetical protein
MSLKSPERLIGDALVAAPAIAELAGDRVYPVIAPASAALPFVTWRRQAVQREATLTGPSGVATVTLAVDMYATTYEGVRELADRCRQTLDGFNGALGNWISVRNVSLLNESDGFVQLAGGDLPPVYSVTQTYTILWQEI